MNPIVTTINTVIDKEGFSIIAEITTDVYTYTSFTISEDLDLIVCCSVNYLTNDKRIFILSKVNNYFIKEQEIIINDKNVTNEFGYIVDVKRYGKDNIIVISDDWQLASDGKTPVGCVYIYKLIPGEGWCCIKELTLLDGVKELYKHFGNYVKLNEDGLIVNCIKNNKQEFFLFKTDNFLHFNKEKIEYTPILETNSIRDETFFVEMNEIKDKRVYNLKYKYQ